MGYLGARSLLFLISLLGISQGLFASTPKVEPVIGYEHKQHPYPEPASSSSSLNTGLRIIYGAPVFSGEAEISQSLGTRDFESTQTKVKNKGTRASLGFRSTKSFWSIFGLYVRGGVRLNRDVYETTDLTTDIVTEKDSGIYMTQYVGGGLQIALAQNLALFGDASTSYRSGAPAINQVSFGASVKFGK